MYLSSNTVIHCSHGGRLLPDDRHFIKLGKQRLLTKESVLNGKIVDCDQCQKVKQLISGYESDDPKAPLLTNLDFITDSLPVGRAVILGEPVSKKDSGRRALLLTSLVWMCLAIAAVLVTIYYYEERLNTYQTKVRGECIGQINTLADELIKK